MMSGRQSEVGISPVLLQAISHTLTSTTLQHNDTPAGTQLLLSQDTPHILQGMNTPVKTAPDDDPPTTVIEEETSVEEPQTVQPLLVIKEEKRVTPKVEMDMPMGSVLSAIASHLKNSRKRPAPKEVPPDIPSHNTSQPIYIKMPPQSSVPCSVNNVTISDANGNANDGIPIIQTFSPSDLPSRYEATSEEEIVSTDGATTLVVDASQLQDGTVLETDFGTFSVTCVSSSPPPAEKSNTELYGPCPICTDRISGYHYGIYTCESCKGFFKRTVQNKKSFVCHRNGECEINVGNRKKCPACRFQRCLLFGMKLEAIRCDRTRGGRSSYEGCLPSVRSKTPNSKPQKATDYPLKIAQEQTLYQVQYEEASPSQPTNGQVGSAEFQVEPNTGFAVVSLESPARAAVVIPEEVAAAPPQTPQTPQLLEDLQTLESLVMEEEGEKDCCRGRLEPGDLDQFGSLLHIADHCLYRIVRWARNLPEFSNVSTDDQILLLQNCWSELLCLSVCWNSTRGDGFQLLLSHGRSLTLEMSKAMALAEVIQRLLDFTQHMKRLELDAHEYAALKVLILMSPDVENLQQPSVVRDYQERIQEALMVHSLTHYPSLPHKHADQLTRLAELTRTCALGRELLKARQAAGEVPQFSLLSELLKGVVGTGEGTTE